MITEQKSQRQDVPTRFMLIDVQVRETSERYPLRKTLQHELESLNPREYTLKRAHLSALNAEQASVTIYIFQTWESINTEPKIWRKSSFISSNIHELLLFSSPQRLKVRYKVRGTALFPFCSSELQWELKFTSSAWSLREYCKNDTAIAREKYLYS